MIRTVAWSTGNVGRHAIGDPDEIAAIVLTLASRAGGFMTGKVVEVDGGTDVPTLDMGLPDLPAADLEVSP